MFLCEYEGLAHVEAGDLEQPLGSFIFASAASLHRSMSRVQVSESSVFFLLLFRK